VDSPKRITCDEPDELMSLDSPGTPQKKQCGLGNKRIPLSTEGSVSSSSDRPGASVAKKLVFSPEKKDEHACLDDEENQGLPPSVQQSVSTVGITTSPSKPSKQSQHYSFFKSVSSPVEREPLEFSRAFQP
jgi:hypothetical protein